MKLIDEIKKAEEKTEKMKAEARVQGQNLVEQERENAKKSMLTLDGEREKLIETKLKEARRAAENDMKKLQNEHEKNIKHIEHAYKKNKDRAVKKVHEIILTWPSSR